MSETRKLAAILVADVPGPPLQPCALCIALANDVLGLPLR